MNKEDYFKYYIQGSEHYLIPKDIFDELFDEMESWKEDTQKYKEVIDKAIEFINNNGAKQYNHHDNYRGKWYSPDELDTILDILKGNNE